jgi:hypothetical protein
VETTPIGKPGIDHRTRSIDAKTERGDHTLDRRQELLVARKGGIGTTQLASSIDPHLLWAIDQDIRDLGVPQQRFERAQAKDPIDDGSG